MSRARSTAGHALRVGLDRLDRTAEQLRRAAFLAQVRKSAWQVGSTVELDVSPDLLVGRGLSVTVAPQTHNVLRIGPRCRLDDRVRLILRGGQLLLGDTVEVRKDVVFSVEGVLEIAGEAVISYGTTFHCSQSILLERQIGCAEHVTFVDSSHFFTTPEEFVIHNVRKGTVRVGRGSWICPKATIARGADIGEHCIVGSGSVVVGLVPDDHLASGVPAVLSPLSQPWG